MVNFHIQSFAAKLIPKLDEKKGPDGEDELGEKLKKLKKDKKGGNTRPRSTKNAECERGDILAS